MLKPLAIIISLLFAALAGYGVRIFEGWFAEARYVEVHIFDQTECGMSTVKLHLKDRTIFVSDAGMAAMLDRPGTGAVIIPLVKHGVPIDYSLNIEFSSCPSINSGVRTYNYGTVLYEYVQENEVIHEVRG